MQNQLKLPQFDLDIQQFPQQLDAMLKRHLQQIDALLAATQDYTWDNLMMPLDDLDDELEQFWSPMAHLHAVTNSKALRECYQACLPLLSAYESAIGHHQGLYQGIKSLDGRPLTPTQQKIVTDSLRDFELSGVALPEDKKHRFEAIQHRLSELSNQFENHLLDASQAFSLTITDEKRLQGLPAHALHTAAELAKEKGVDGWMFNLEIPCFLAVVTYAEDRALREAIYAAYVTRASDQGPSAGQFDNTPIMNEMLQLKQEKAALLGFNNYAELSLATKMADSAATVLGFLEDLAHKAYPQAKAEFQQLSEFAAAELGISPLQPWDVAFASEKLRQARYQVSQEDYRPYFPQTRVVQGLFEIVEKLYGVRMAEYKGAATWHPEVICYQILDEANQTRGLIYCDFYARQHKRGGAWMDVQQSRRKLADGHIQLPIATLTCNFAKPAKGKEGTLSHDEVTTLFHEFGHCLHHVLTQVDDLGASGIRGVEWDAVELPSQFFENWCWEQEALALLTAHVDTGEPLPQDLFDKLVAAKNFQSAMAMMRQLEFSLFDFRIHHEYQTGEADFIAKTLASVRQETAVVPIAPYNRFQHSFSHIFAGGYSAGYYSYKWAEVLSSDAFARFEEEGIFNQKTGHDFLHQILEVGGSRQAQDSFTAFRGREAQVDALLRHNGIGVYTRNL